MKAIMFVLPLLLTGSLSLAQTKISGKVQYSPPDQHTSLEVGDHPNHALALLQGKCTWTKPMKVAGAKTKDAAYTASSDALGDRAHNRGYIIDTLDSGDKYTISVQATVILKNSKPVSQRGTWTIVSGTGKLKGIQGKGTFRGKPEGDNMVSSVEGEYVLPK